MPRRATLPSTGATKTTRNTRAQQHHLDSKLRMALVLQLFLQFVGPTLIHSHRQRPLPLALLSVRRYSSFSQESRGIRSRTSSSRSSLHSRPTFSRKETTSLTMTTTAKTATTTTKTTDDDDNTKLPFQEPPILAKVVEGNDNDMLMECARRLRNGDLVAFPTETVYGLGCNALLPDAIHKVFQAKERPLTDPLIVHVANNDHAFSLWRATTAILSADNVLLTNGNVTTWSSSLDSGRFVNGQGCNEHTAEGRVLRALTDQFWPGPLTLVAKACDHVPEELMANTGFVACRRPLHALASALIEQAGVPIAAPSANKFGHVSPTTAKHVWDDLKHENVWILNGTGCSVGVESSVAKVETTDNVVMITLLRQGIVSLADIEACLDKSGISKENVVQLQLLTKRATADNVANVAPGQTIRHYSPKIPSYMLASSLYQDQVSSLTDDQILYLSKTVLIDFGGLLWPWRDHVLAYRDLSQQGAPDDAARLLYDTLRWAEQVEGADRILFPQFTAGENDAFALAVIDRLTRAASGVTISQLQ